MKCTHILAGKNVFTAAQLLAQALISCHAIILVKVNTFDHITLFFDSQFEK